MQEGRQLSYLGLAVSLKASSQFVFSLISLVAGTWATST